MAQCVLIPRVQKSNGEWVDSKLFADISNYIKTNTGTINRDVAMKTYRVATDDKFIEDYGNILIFDENGEATLDSVLRETNLNTLLGVEPVSKKEEEAKELNYKLNNRIRDILLNSGISIGALTELEKRLGAKGVADFDKANTTAEGLLEMIRIAEGVIGEQALPEEFAHIVIESMLDTPLMGRMINLIKDKNLSEEILGEQYSDYVDTYKGDATLLAKESLGKLLTQHFFNNTSIENSQYKSLLQRLIESIKQFLKKIDANSIQKSILEINNELSNIATDILVGNKTINVAKITSNDKLYFLDERISRDKKLLKEMIATEVKRFKIINSKSNAKLEDTVKQREFVDELVYKLEEGFEMEGIFDFLETASNTLLELNDSINTIRNSDSMSPGEIFTKLREIRNYAKSYAVILSKVKTNYAKERLENDDRYGQKIDVYIKEINHNIDTILEDYKNISLPLFVEFLKPFIGESLTIPSGKRRGETMNLDDLLKVADKDISFFDLWLDSMSDSSNIIIKLFDQAIKKNKEKARLRIIDLSKEIQAAGIELEQAGINDTDWMYEKDSEGNITGNYISEYDMPLFNKVKLEFFEDLKKRYEDKDSVEDIRAYNNEVAKWYTENTVPVTKKPNVKYLNKNFPKVGTPKRIFYDKMMDIKKELDLLLPEGEKYNGRIIGIRKDLIERVKDSKNIKDGATTIWESIKDDYIRREDDVEFGTTNTIMDFEGREVETLPIYYTNLNKFDNKNDISTDIISTLTAYASMAIEFDEMSNSIDALEVGRDLVRDMEVQKNRGDKTLKESFNSLGVRVENKLTKQNETPRIISRLDKGFSMQVYGRYIADEGNFLKTNISNAKLANQINKITSINSLALNLLSSIASVGNGSIMMRIESMAGQFFNMKNATIADKNYSTHLPAYLAEIGKRVKTSKLALWGELFDTSQNYDTNIRNTNFDRKTWASRMLNMNTLFFLSNSGEHWMQNRTSLALADAYKMKDSKGNIVSLWDAFEVQYIDNNNPNKGGKLVLKQGYTKEDGTEFTDNDLYAFKQKTNKLNQRMHGIYNQADRNAFQQMAIGRIAFMFRKWIPSALNRRFADTGYDYDLDAWSEGYYRTSFNFLRTLLTDIRQGQFDIATNWNRLDKLEKANIVRASVELGHFASIALLLGIIDWDEDKEETPYALKLVEYQLRRLQTEIGALIPGPTMMTEGWQILKSPAAAVNTLEGIANTVKILNPLAWQDELQSGKYKGHSEAYKALFESPFIPMNKTLYRVFNPEEPLQFYKQ